MTHRKNLKIIVFTPLKLHLQITFYSSKKNITSKTKKKQTKQKGYQLYVTLTTEEILLEVEKSSKILWYYMFTYGSSFTIVAISLAIDPSAYTQADYCVWMEANYLFYFTFVAPVFIYITVSWQNDFMMEMG